MIESSIFKMIIDAREAYYNSGHPIMSDQEYDSLIEMVKASEPDHPILSKIGHTPSSMWKKASHNMPMGSLEKVNTEEEFRKWASKYPSQRFILEYKLDGLSVSLDYKDGQLVRGVTRGDGLEGEDITPNVLRMRDVVKTISGFSGSIRAEIVLSKHEFNRINMSLPEKDRYSNTRNAAAGICRRLDGLYCDYLYVIAHDLMGPHDEDRKIVILRDWGFMTACSKESWVGDIETIIKGYNETKAIRKSLPMDIDGMVVKVVSRDVQEKAGFTAKKPKAQTAWKFDAPSCASTLQKTTWELGRTGVLTPVGHIDPVTIDGSVIRKVTLHNIAEIKRLGIGIGDLVVVAKMNDVIPKILSVIEHRNNPIDIPTLCPICSTELINDDIRLMCPNDFCVAKEYNRILHWIKSMVIDQFGEALLDVLYESGKVRHIKDLYALKDLDISSLEGWGEQSAGTIIGNIQKSLETTETRVLAALGIPTISDRTAEELIKVFGSIKDLMGVSRDQIASLKGFSDISADKIILGLTKYGPELIELVQLIKKPLQQSSNGILFGKSFCFTGAMEHPRPYYQGLVTENGGKNLSSVTKDLNYLVCNEDKGSTKSQKAAKYGIKIINEKEFLGMIGSMVQELIVAPEPEKGPQFELPSLFQ